MTSEPEPHFPDAPSLGSVDNRWAWSIASVPLACLVLNAALLFAGLEEDTAGIIATVAGLFGYGPLLARDQDALVAAGHRPWNWVLGLVLLPLYLVVRAVKWAPRAWPIPVVWLAALLVWSGGSAAVAALVPVAVDTDGLSVELTDWLDENGVNGQARCPREVTRSPGDTFVCEVVGTDEVSFIEVTVVDRSGWLTWEAVS